MFKYFIPLTVAFLLSNISFAQVEINFPNLSGTCGSTIDIPITVSNFNSILAAQFSVEWDTDVLQHNGQTVIGLGQTFNFGTSQLSNGQLGFSWFDGNQSGETLMDGDTLFIINFTVLGGASGTALNFTNFPTNTEFGGLGVVLPFTTNPGTFTIIDTFKPTFSQCPGSASHNAASGSNTAVVNFISAIASDNCEINTLDYVLTGATTGTGQDASGVAFNTGVTTVTYTATDFVGNSEVCSFNITVNSTGQAPITITPASINVGCTGTSFTLDLLVDNFTDINVLQYSVNWDPAVLQFMATTNLSNQLSNATFGSSSTASGILTFSWVDGMGNGETMPNGSVMFSLNFNVINTFTTSPVTISGNTLGIFAQDTPGNQVTVNTNFGVITASDTQNPVIVGCPTDQTINATTGSCTGTATWVTPTATDNCSVTSFTNSHNSGSNFAFGNTTVTYIATDPSNNTATCSFVLTVVDNEMPTVTCPANVNMSVATGVTNTIVNGIAPISSNDNCGVSSTTYNLAGATVNTGINNASGAVFNVGTTTLTYTVMDNSGNSGTCTSNVTITQTTTPNLDTLTAFVDPFQIDCDDTNVIVNIGLNDVEDITKIQFTIEWDPAVLQYNTANNLILPAVNGFGVVQTSAGILTYSWNEPSNSPVNLADGTLIIRLNFILLGTTIGTSSAISITGNTAPISAETSFGLPIPFNTTGTTFTVGDQTMPTITSCPTSQTINNDPGTCFGFPNWANPTATDNCDTNVTITESQQAGTAFPVGTTTVVVTATDNFGNAATCNFQITVNETEIPTIVCPTNISMNVPAGTGTTVINNIAFVSSNDNCGVTSTTYTLSGATSITGNNDASGNAFNTGTTVVTYTATDASGNIGTCSSNVTIIEDMLPTNDTLGVYVNPLIVECDDNVSIDIGLFNVDELTSLQFTVEWDPSVFQYNSHTNLILPATTNFGITQIANGRLTYSWFGGGGVSVNYPDSTLIVNLDLTLLAGIGVVSSIDITGNVTFIEAGTIGGVPIPVNVFGTGITVIDTTNPTLTLCPRDQQVNATAGLCSGVANWQTPTATDNCDNNISLSSTFNSGDTFPVGTTIVTYTATDDAGNTGTCQFNVVVNDNQNPSIINCPANIILNNDPGTCAAIATWTPPTLTDNCSTGTSIVGTHIPGSSFPVGTTNVSYAGLDAAGNNALICNFNVIISDNENPIITCPQDTTILIPFNTSAPVVTGIAPVSFSDNCVNLMETFTMTGATTGSGNNDASGSTFNLGTTLITYTTEDNQGNDASCTFNVAIFEQNPGNTLTVIAENDTIDCSAQTVTIDFTVEEFTDISSVQFSVNWDNSVLQYVSNTPTTLPATVGIGVAQLANGIITYSWFDSDGSTETFPDGTVIFSVDFNVIGNVNSNSIIFINDTPTPIEGATFNGVSIPVFTVDGSFAVSDLTPPVIAGCPVDFTISNDAGLCGANATWTAPTATDVCSNFTTTSTHQPGDFFPVGTTPVTYTYIDDFGNQSTCDFTVTVTDNELPIYMNCPADITQINDAGICAAAVFWPSLILADNCGNAIATSTHSPGFIFPLGTTNVMYTATEPTSNNTAFCSFNVTVNDTDVPAIVCMSDTTIIVPFGMTSSIVNTIQPESFTDNCGVDTISYVLTGPTTGTGGNDASGQTFNEGTTTVTYTVTDDAGNTASCDFNVIVIEQNPGNTLTVIAENDTLNCDAQSVTIDFNVENFTNIASLQFSVNWDPSILLYNSNSIFTLPPNTGVGTTQIANGILTFSWFDSDLSTETLPDGTKIFAITFDVIGPLNSSSIIYINDNTTFVEASTFNGTQVPVFTTDGSFVLTDLTGPFITGCPTDISVSNDLGLCEAAVTWTPPTAADDCSNVTTTSSHIPGALFPVGMTPVLYEFSDQFGNLSACSFNVTVTDDESPVIDNCPNDIIVNTNPTTCSAVVNWTVATAIDNCGSVSLTCSNSPGDTFPIGSTFVSCTAADDIGNVSLCSFQVTVIDNQDPTIICPSDLSVNVNNGMSSMVVNGISPTGISDNCMAPTVTYTLSGATSSFGNNDASGETFNVGVTTVTYTIVDASGNTVACSFDVEVIELFPPGTPTFTIEDNMIACGTNSFTIDFLTSDFTNITDFQYTIEWDPTLLSFNGIIGNTLPPTSLLGTSQLNNGILTYAWTSGNINGATIPDGIIYALNFTILGNFNTTDVELTGSVTPIEANGPGNVPVMINTINGTVDFNDNEPPVFTGCPTDITEPALTGTCQTNVAWTEPSVTDECSITDLTQSHNPGDIFPVGITTVDYVAIDGFGNSSTCVFNVTVIDNQPPQIICPGNVNANQDPNNVLCGNFVTWQSVIVADNCGTDNIASVTSTHNSADFFPIGNTLVTYTATDTDGTSISCSFNVSIVDETTPAIACPDNIEQAIDPGMNGAIVTWDAIPGFDNCPFEMSCSSNSGDFFAPGTTLVLCNIEDANGNSNDCNFTITITDCNTPIFTNCPADINLTNEAGLCGAVANWDPIVLNAACSDGNLICSHNPGDFFPVGVTQVNCTAQDITGNTVACVFNVTVEDIERPSFTSCPADITMSATDCNAIVNWTLPETSDNCSVVDTTSSHNPGDAFPIGTTTISYAIRDAENNTDVCTFMVTVEDNTTPVFNTCPADITLNASGANCNAVYTWPDPIVVDNCGLSSVTSSHNSGDTFPSGITTVSYTASDGSGNVATCSFTINVSGSAAPTLTCTSIVRNDTNGDCEAAVTWPNVLSGGDCGTNVTLVCSNDSGDLFPVGSTFVSCSLIDGNGDNVDACTFEVTVNDITEPTITGCPSNIQVNNTANLCTTEVNWSAPNALDDCGIASFTTNANSGDAFNIGTTTVTYIATDVNGLTETCSFDVTVVDSEIPVSITCPDDFTIEPNNGLCGAVVSFTEPTFADNCTSNLNVTNNVSPNDTLNIGTTTITYIATDDNGNALNCTFNVTVNGGSTNVSITASPSDSICFGNPVTLAAQASGGIVDTYSWTGPNGFTSAAESPMITNFQAVNSGDYTLVVNYVSGCTGTGNITLTGVDETTVQFNISVSPRDSLICVFPTESLTFTTDLDPSQYSTLFWITPSGDTVTTTELQLIGVENADSGIYTAVAQTNSGCTASATQTVFISTVPNAPTVTGLPTNNAICLGESFTLSATSDMDLGPDDHFNWASDPLGECAGLPSQTDEQSATILPSCPDTYIYFSSVLIDGCLSTLEQVSVTVLDIPSPQNDQYDADFESTLFGFDVTLNDELNVNPDVFEIDVTQNVSNGTLINNGDGTFDYTPDQGFIGEDRFAYEICFDVCGENFCGFAIVTLNVEFENGCPIPTVLTPNGDGLNDELFIPCVEGNPDAMNNQLIIFNEWGDEVYKAEPYLNDWFGTYNDEPLPDGTYFYIFRLDDNLEHTKGYITILR